MSQDMILFKLDDFDPRHAKRGDWLGRIAHLSASSLGMFRRCPRQWQQRYLLGRKEPPGEGLVIGNFFHETCNWNYGQKISSHEDRPLDEVIEYLQDAAVPRVLDAAGGVGEIRWDLSDPVAALDAARSDAQRITTAYHRQVMPRIQPEATEQRMEWHVGLPVPLIGYLDTVQPESIVDTKTGRQAPSKLKPGWQLQADIYSSYLGKPIEYHTINRAATPKINTPLECPDLLVVPKPDEVANLVSVIQHLVTQIEWMFETLGPDGDWPTWGRFADWTQNVLPCTYCGYRKATAQYPACPAWS